MLQYLINMTAIWVISLLVFDVFLRRDGFHGYNRAYLLFTFVLGVALPLLHWQHGAAIYTAAAAGQIYTGQPVAQMAAANTVHASGNIIKAHWLSALYLAGAVAASGLLVREALKLVVLYRKGRKTPEGIYTLIETGHDHTPFSFRHMVFVNSRGQYSAAEWQMILHHEGQHSTLWHLADILLLQAARVVFWFHPLVYIYNKRLLLVHEYQADSHAARDRQDYCHFLLEQSLLHAAPAITHSFNSSPIKNRIMMLTKNSPRARFAKSKLLLTLPLTAVCVFCFTPKSYSGDKVKKGNTVTYKGNVFKMAEEEPVTVQLSPAALQGTSTNVKNGGTGSLQAPKTAIVQDVTVQDTSTTTIQINTSDGHTIKHVLKNGDNAAAPMQMVVKQLPQPAAMNGEKIYNDCDVTEKAVCNRGEKNLEEYVIQYMTGAMHNLPDGEYGLYLNNIVIDKTGHVVYYDNHGLLNWKEDASSFTGTKQIPIQDPAIMEAVDNMMEHIPAYTPAKVNNKAVLCKSSALLPHKWLTVKNHVVALKSVD